MAQTDRINGLTGSVAIKAPCRIGTTANIALSGLQTVDGILLAAGDRVLVKNQTAGAENGIYLASSGVWAREPDFDGARDVVKGTQVEVTDGTVNAGFFFTVATANPILPGTTAIAFTSSAAASNSAVAAAASAATANADAIATAADRVQTGLDRVATAADRVQTGLDRVATAADRVQTGIDAAAAAASASSVNLRTINMQAAGYTVAATDRNKLIEYTGAGGHTVSLPTIATLGGGFEFHVKHAGTGNLVVDANAVGGTTIDGVASITLTAGQAIVIVCNATTAVYDVTQSRGYSSSAASAIINTPSGSIISTDVQSAINELDTEKAALAGATFTGWINEARGTVAMHATTMNLWTQPNTIDGTGAAVVITAIINAPQAGAKRTLYPITGTTITHGAAFNVQGAASYVTAAGDALVFEAVTVSTYNVTIVKAAGIVVAQLQSITASVAANALTATTAATTMDFRNATLTNGAPISGVSVGAGSITVPTGATLGTVNGVAARLVLLTAYNGGTPVDCIVNLSGGVQLDETNLISPTTISAGSTAANVIYSASAVAANSPYRIRGFIDISEATAGTWATAPTLVQGVGGQALATMSSLGYGQTWAAYTGSRAINTTYYNTTGKPIAVTVNVTVTSINAAAAYTVNGVSINWYQAYNNLTNSGCFFIVPPGGSYSVSVVGSLNTWNELR